MIYTTLLNPSFDLIYRIPQNDRDTFLDLPSRFFPAGKGVNCAKVIAELGEEVTLLSLMPEQDSNRFSDYMEEHHVIHKPFHIDGAVRVNTTVYDESTHSTVHYNSAGNKCSTQTQDHFRQFLEGIITDASDTCIMNGSLPGGIELDFYENMIRYCNEKKIRTILDTRGKALEYGLKAIPNIISPNENELEALFEEKIDGVQHLALKGKRLIDSGVGIAFITLGEDGVIALKADECLLCKAPEVEVLDTVGCGDAFLAGVMVGIERGFTFHETCRLAVAAGTSNAAHLGPGEVDRDQVWHLMEKVQVASL